MSTPRILRDEIYNYPDQGDTNYAEDASGWVEEATDILSNVSGPGSIATTEVTLTGSSDGTNITGNITGMVFDTAYIQSIEVQGFITRTYTDTSKVVEAFNIKGAYNGTVINFSVDYSGDETELTFDVSGGQFTFSYLIDDGSGKTTDTVSIKFNGQAIVDESFFA